MGAHTDAEAAVTKEFLEKALKTTLENFVVSPASILGDGSSCVLYSMEVWKKGQTAEDPLHILIKAFPANHARQSFLDLGLFPLELAAYEQAIPELIRFQEGAGVENKVRFPFAPYRGRQYIPKECRNGGIFP